MADSDLFGSEDLFDDEEYRMLGEALQMAEPLPPGLDWDYFGSGANIDDAGELGDTQSPAVDAVFDWGQPLIGNGHVPRGLPPYVYELQRACIPQPCVPVDQWPHRPMIKGWPSAPVVGVPNGLPPKPCPPRPCPSLLHPNGPFPPFVDLSRVGVEDPGEEMCERAVPHGADPIVSGGERFQHLVRQLRARGVRSPEALAAWIGRRKYGRQRFAAMAAAGRRG